MNNASSSSAPVDTSESLESLILLPSVSSKYSTHHPQYHGFNGVREGIPAMTHFLLAVSESKPTESNKNRNLKEREGFKRNEIRIRKKERKKNNKEKEGVRYGVLNEKKKSQKIRKEPEETRDISSKRLKETKEERGEFRIMARFGLKLSNMWLDSLIIPCISDEWNSELIHISSTSEIKDVVWHMTPLKAPKTDGMPEASNCCRISTLIRDDGEWNMELAHFWFVPSVASSLCLISHLPVVGESDKLNWKDDVDGCFSPKAAYSSIIKSCLSDYDPAWKRLWLLKIPDHMKLFLWKLCQDGLPFGNRLSRIFGNVESCTICVENIDSFANLFYLCPLARALWFFSP
ncbi:hypothetical protein F8388_014895 [Cannabis sativa]|uniref:Reverse transcriptase zinc-binding domain-containing protein n=1 Tax=Cannabis sativa TaxID=3483 RepID=A0A7J6F650_CANSA|nr:hypothetical protein F8388_014895 [Cannabis sativa]